MNLKKHLLALLAAVAAITILLMMILWPRSSSPSGLGGQDAAPGSQRESHLPTDVVSAATESPEKVRQVRRFETPDEWFVAGAMSEIYTDTLTGEDFRAGDADVYLGQSPPDGPYLPWYVVGRAYPGWDTSALPDEVEVLSATLVLDLPAGGGREEPLEITVYQGTWNPPLDLDDWQSWDGKEVGRWQLAPSRMEERASLFADEGVTLYAPEPAHTVRVTLDPTVVNTAGITRLELHHAREGTPPTAASVILLGRKMISLEVEYRP